MTAVTTPLARFSLGRAFAAAIGLVRRHAVSLFIAAAVFGFLPSLATEFVSRHFLVNQPIPTVAGGDWGAYWRGFALSELVAILAGAISFPLQGYVAILAAGSAETPTPGPSEILRRLAGATAELYGLGLVVTAAVTLGLIVLLIPGLLLQLAWNAVAQVAALENRGFLGSLQRSAELTRGHRWALFGLLVLLGLASGAAAACARLAGGGSFLRLSASDPWILAYGIAPAVAGVMSTVTAVLLACVYFELAAAKDGVASHQLAATFD